MVNGDHGNLKAAAPVVDSNAEMRDNTSTQDDGRRKDDDDTTMQVTAHN